MLEAALTQGQALLVALTQGEIRSMVLRSVISHLKLTVSSLLQLLFSFIRYWSPRTCLTCCAYAVY